MDARHDSEDQLDRYHVRSTHRPCERGGLRDGQPCRRTPGFVAWQVALGPVVELVPAAGHEQEYARRQPHGSPCVGQKQGQMSWTTLQESQLLLSSIETSQYL